MDRGINAVNGGGNNINRDEIPSTEVWSQQMYWGNTVTSGEDIHKRNGNSCEKRVKYWEWKQRRIVEIGRICIGNMVQWENF